MNAANPQFTLDLTAICVTLITAMVPIIGTILTLVISSRMKDKQAAETLAAAVRNAVGALGEAGKHGLEAMRPRLAIPGVPMALQPGVQYVLDHAGDEAERLGITPDKIAEKVVAQLGLSKIKPPTIVIPALPSSPP